MVVQCLFRTIVTFVVVLLFACTQEPNDPPAQVESKPQPDNMTSPPKIMLMTKSQSNPYYVMMEQGARKAADELGATLISKATPNETQVALQKKLFLSAIEEGFDAIVFVPSKTAQLLPVLKEIQQQGIVLVNLDDQINATQAEKIDLSPIPFVGIDNRTAAQEMAERVLEKNPDVSSAYILLGPESSSVSQARAEGFRNALATHQRRLLGEESANWQYVEAYELSENVLAQHPDIDAFFCANDVMALGVLKMLQDKNQTQIKVIGYDAIPEAREFVEEGRMEATLDQQSYQQGFLGIQTAVALLNGENVESESWVSPELVISTE